MQRTFHVFHTNKNKDTGCMTHEILLSLDALPVQPGNSKTVQGVVLCELDYRSSGGCQNAAGRKACSLQVVHSHSMRAHLRSRIVAVKTQDL